MHSAEREQLILGQLRERGFVSFLELKDRMRVSPATIRRDLARLAEAGVITRIHGGAKLAEGSKGQAASKAGLRVGQSVTPFHESTDRNRHQKELIGRAAARLCNAGEAVVIDGGSTTLQMCPHLAGLNLQVLTNSLLVVGALLQQTGTRVLVPSGQVFADRNLILSAAGDDNMPRFHAPKLFIGAASLGPVGLMQADIILVAAKRRLIERADQVIVLVDSSKFTGPSGQVVCRLEEIDVIVTDQGVSAHLRKVFEKAGIKVIVAQD